MNPPFKTLFEKQVDLTRALLALRFSMDAHLATNVLPHLDEPARSVVWQLIEHLREQDANHPVLLVHLDRSMVAIGKVIAAGTIVSQVAIPRERLIGCSEAFDTRTSCTPPAAALRAALPPVERLYDAAREAHEFAEAIRLSLERIDMKK